MKTSGAKTLLVALAAIALALLLLKPLCDVHTAMGHHGQERGVAAQLQYGSNADPQCCQSVHEGGIATPADVATLGRASGLPAIAFLAMFFIATVSLVRGVRELPGAPPGPHSYYARTARILR